MNVFRLVLTPLLSVIAFITAVIFIAGCAFGWVAFPMILGFKFHLPYGQAFVAGEVLYLIWLGILYAILEGNT